MVIHSNTGHQGQKKEFMSVTTIVEQEFKYLASLYILTAFMNWDVSIMEIFNMILKSQSGHRRTTLLENQQQHS